MNKQPLREISEDEIRTFEEDGIICVRGVLDDEWVARMQHAIDAILDHPTKFGQNLNEADEPGRYAFDNNMWMFHDDFKAFVFDSPMAETAAKFLRSQMVNLIFDYLLVKEPHTPTPTTWHQDMPGNPVEGSACGMWVSLDHVTAESGSVQWARGSHKWNKRYDPVGDGRMKREGYGFVGDQPTLEAMPDIAGNPDKYEVSHLVGQFGSEVKCIPRADHAAKFLLITFCCCCCWAGGDVGKPSGLSIISSGSKPSQATSSCLIS